MRLSNDNEKTLMLAVNQEIEETAEAHAAAISDGSIAKLVAYPPNGGFSSAEQEALNIIRAVPNAESALRKVMASASACAFFTFFNILDGTGDPKHEVGNWTGATLMDNNDDDDPYTVMLHDAFFDAYWAWRKTRKGKGWALDTAPDIDLLDVDVWSSYD